MHSPIILLSLLTICSEAGSRRREKDPQDDDSVAPSIDVVAPPAIGQSIFVPFGHIFKDGVQDPYSDQKQPLDFLELHLKTPRSRAEAERMLKETPKDRILRLNKRRFELYNEDEDLRLANSEKEKLQTKSTSEDPRWIDFAGIHNERLSDTRPVPTPVPLPSEKPVLRYSPHMPPRNQKNDEIEPNPYKGIKWTSCREFAKGSSSFHPKDIVDINWTPFYIWSPRKLSAVVHRFTYPTKKLVREYKLLYGPHLNATLDWEQPKLMLNESIEMLLIADPKDRRGLFHAVPRRPLPKDKETLKLAPFSVAQLRVKIADPYLALTYCNEYHAAVMSSPGNDPLSDEERIEEASTLDFKGIGYPVKINVEDMFATWKAIQEKQRDEEERKYIKALNVDAIKVDMD